MKNTKRMLVNLFLVLALVAWNAPIVKTVSAATEAKNNNEDKHATEELKNEIMPSETTNTQEPETNSKTISQVKNRGKVTESYSNNKKVQDLAKVPISGNNVPHSGEGEATKGSNTTLITVGVAAATLYVALKNQSDDEDDSTGYSDSSSSGTLTCKYDNSSTGICAQATVSGYSSCSSAHNAMSSGYCTTYNALYKCNYGAYSVFDNYFTIYYSTGGNYSVSDASSTCSGQTVTYY
ncbi:MAG: hypothetical protein HQL68_00530 [Magnetococcales bacterium]|nr:hypothetical protein [Magnetococcales bacterium]